MIDYPGIVIFFAVNVGGVLSWKMPKLHIDIAIGVPPGKSDQHIDYEASRLKANG